MVHVGAGLSRSSGLRGGARRWAGVGWWGGGGVQWNWTVEGAFDIHFCVFFGWYCRGLISGVWALGYASTQIWDFSNIPNFLWSFGNSRDNSYIKFIILHIIRFVLLVATRTCTKTFKVPNYYDQDCRYRIYSACSKFSEKHFLSPDTQTYVCILGGKKC